MFWVIVMLDLHPSSVLSLTEKGSHPRFTRPLPLVPECDEVILYL